jgi:tetratricopeptide (TPR) repeat protein
MKQDSFVTTALKASEYFQKNKNYVYIGVGVLVVIVVAISLISYSIKQKAVNTENLFGDAQLAAAMGQWEQSITNYRDIVENYGSSDIAYRACFYLAKTYYEHDQLDSALTYFEKYIDDYKKQPFLLTAAYAGAANCLEQLNDKAKAGDYYMKAAETADNDTDSPDYYSEAGRVYDEAGQKDKAKAAYQIIIDKYMQSAQFSAAKKRLAEIEYAQN